VLLVPTHTTPHKADLDDGRGGRDPGPMHRLRMCQLALDGIDGVSACAIEIERGGLSYTVDTLRSLHASHLDAELTLIIGADTASTLGSWHESQPLLELASVAVAARAPLGAHPRGRGQAGAAQQPLPAGVRARFLEMPAIEVSSSMVRTRVANGEAVDDLVGPAVARYIAEHGLYRARRARAEALA
jgi:nicotinate-nucleotide adenylyltransferase